VLCSSVLVVIPKSSQSDIHRWLLEFILKTPSPPNPQRLPELFHIRLGMKPPELPPTLRSRKRTNDLVASGMFMYKFRAVIYNAIDNDPFCYISFETLFSRHECLGAQRPPVLDDLRPTTCSGSMEGSSVSGVLRDA
jgi:hypothetical protein